MRQTTIFLPLLLCSLLDQLLSCLGSQALTVGLNASDKKVVSLLEHKINSVRGALVEDNDVPRISEGIQQKFRRIDQNRNTRSKDDTKQGGGMGYAGEQRLMTEENNVDGSAAPFTVSTLKDEDNGPNHQPQRVKENSETSEYYSNALGIGDKQSDPGAEITEKYMNSNEKERTSVPLPILLLGFAFAALIVRKKLLEGSMLPGVRNLISLGANDVSDSPIISDDFTYGLSTMDSGRISRRRFVEEETAPFTSRINDDEWGWENSSSSGDIELGSKDVLHEDDMQMALALSLSENASVNAGTKANLSHENNSTSSTHTIGTKPISNMTKDGSWDAEGSSWEDSPSVSSLATTALAHNNTIDMNVESLLREQTSLIKHIPTGSRVTSLSSKLSSSSKVSKSISLSKVSKAQEQDEDIFASMGLSALAKKEASEKMKESGHIPSSTKLSWNDNVHTDSMKVSSCESSIQENSNWDDDNDLDDLLED